MDVYGKPTLSDCQASKSGHSGQVGLADRRRSEIRMIPLPGAAAIAEIPKMPTTIFKPLISIARLATIQLIMP